MCIAAMFYLWLQCFMNMARTIQITGTRSHFATRILTILEEKLICNHVVSSSSFSVEILGYDCRQKQGSD